MRLLRSLRASSPFSGALRTERRAALTEEKEAVTRHYEELKRRMMHFREAEHERLKRLTIASREVIKQLQEKLDLVGTLLPPAAIPA